MGLKPIEEQVAAVVGASSGIGRETALHFAQRGALLVVAAHDQHGLDSLVSEIEQRGGRAAAVVADMADFAQVQTMIGQITVRSGDR